MSKLDKNVILPGATLGVLGSGQLGRMFAIAGRKMGYRVHTFSPDDDTPTGQVADVEVKADYNDLDAVKKFASGVDVITFEFENVAFEAANAAAQVVPVRPGGGVLHTTQHRLREKTFLSKNGFPVTRYEAVRSLDELKGAIGRIGCPGVLKTAGWGYDGKGQSKIMTAADAEPAWKKLGTGEAILEAMVDFACEVSVVAARGVDGSFAHFGVIQNAHANHILDVSIAPAPVSAKVQREAIEVARGILDKLEVVGLLCVEFFLTKKDELLVNELAPRPHNSGHLTFDACVTCQFEQQVRSICGLPLGSTAYYAPAAMANLLGDVWANGEPDWAAALRDGDVKLHLYGKAQARPGRKMGHLTALAPTVEEAAAKVVRAREVLMRKGLGARV